MTIKSRLWNPFKQKNFVFDWVDATQLADKTYTSCRILYTRRQQYINQCVNQSINQSDSQFLSEFHSIAYLRLKIREFNKFCFKKIIENFNRLPQHNCVWLYCGGVWIGEFSQELTTKNEIFWQITSLSQFGILPSNTSKPFPSQFHQFCIS